MKNILLLIFSCLSFVVCAQSFQNIEGNSLQGYAVYSTQEFNIKINNSQILFENKGNEKTQNQINIETKESKINHKLLYNKKLKKGFLFIERHGELSEGCKIYSLDNGRFAYLCEFPFAAYTSENGDRMNYNNILPYVSVIKSDKRILLFMNTPMVVLNPNNPNEEILESKNFYHILTSEGFQMQQY